MKVEFDKSFYKGLTKIKDITILENVKKIILQVENSPNIQHIANIKKLVGYKSFYRIRFGDYRIGLELKEDTIWFIIIENRKNIYKIFP